MVLKIDEIIKGNMCVSVNNNYCDIILWYI